MIGPAFGTIHHKVPVAVNADLGVVYHYRSSVLAAGTLHQLNTPWMKWGSSNKKFALQRAVEAPSSINHLEELHAWTLFPS